MPYVRFVPGYTSHPKRLKSGPVSSWLWACSVDFCTVHLTDGFLMNEAVPTLCPNITASALKRAVDNLIAVKSWEPVTGGYMVHDYLRHNLSREQAEEDQEQGRQRYYRWADKRRSNAVTNALDQPIPNALDQRSPNGVTNDTHSQSVSQLDIKPTTSKGTIAHATGSDELEQKRRDALALLHRAYPGLKAPGSEP
jgi:hypothetical protein